VIRRIGAFFLFATILLSGSLFAEAACSSNAYAYACANCAITGGKMNEACYDKYIDGGVECVATSYPLLAVAYNSGKCPQADECQRNLEICKAVTSDGNDKTDCSLPAMQDCYVEADACMAAASSKCGGDQAADAAINICAGGPTLGLILLFGFVRSRKPSSSTKTE